MVDIGLAQWRMFFLKATLSCRCDFEAVGLEAKNINELCWDGECI